MKSWLSMPHHVQLPSPAQSAKQRDTTQQMTSNVHGGEGRIRGPVISKSVFGVLDESFRFKERTGWGVRVRVGAGSQGQGVVLSVHPQLSSSPAW